MTELATTQYLNPRQLEEVAGNDISDPEIQFINQKLGQLAPIYFGGTQILTPSPDLNDPFTVFFQELSLKYGINTDALATYLIRLALVDDLQRVDFAEHNIAVEKGGLQLFYLAVKIFLTKSEGI
jgi:hypothetical protein